MLFNIHICQLVLLALEHEHIQVLPLLQDLEDLDRPQLNSLAEIHLGVVHDGDPEEVSVLEGELLISRLI